MQYNNYIDIEMRWKKKDNYGWQAGRQAGRQGSDWDLINHTITITITIIS